MSKCIMCEMKNLNCIGVAYFINVMFRNYFDQTEIFPFYTIHLNICFFLKKINILAI